MNRIPIVVLLAGSLYVPLLAMAQETNDVSSADDTTQEAGANHETAPGDAQKLEAVEVTGSRIKRIDIAGPSPITVLDRPQIEHSGLSTVSELLSRLPQIGYGSFNETNTNSFAPGSSGASLRGLGQNRTLVLIDGRRFPNYGFAQGMTDSFVDLNSLPAAAVERIEVLRDGASAIYGSDAMAGVINIILRKDYQGAEVWSQYGDTVKGDAPAKHVSGVTGTSLGRGSITAAFDYYDRGQLGYADRSFSRRGDHSAHRNGIDFRGNSGQPGYGLLQDASGVYSIPTADPACPPNLQDGYRCRYDYNPYETLVPATERYGGFVNGQYDLTDHLTTYASLVINHSSTVQRFTPTPVGSSAGIIDPAGAPGNPFGQSARPIFAALDLGSRVDDINNLAMRSILGFKGDFDMPWLEQNWNYDVGYNYGRTETDQRGKHGYINRNDLQSAVESGLYIPFGGVRNSNAALDAIETYTHRSSNYETSSGDFSLSGTLFDLPAGPLGMAFGAEYRDEQVRDVPDSQTKDDLIIAQGGTSNAGQRHAISEYLEFSVPVHRMLEAQLAVRHEDYSDFGTTTKPKFGLTFKPFASFLLRGSYAEGFRAPSLAETNIQGAQAYYGGIEDPLRCGATGRDADCGLSGSTEAHFYGNPDLSPEKSSSYNFGPVWQVTDSFTIEMDFWHYKITDIIDTDPRGTISRNADNPDIVVRNPATPQDIALGIPGSIEYFNLPFVNMSARKTSGIDTDWYWRLPSTSIGRFDASLHTTYILYQKNKYTENDPWEQWAGTYAGIGPRAKATASVDWTKDPYGATLSANYLGSYEDNDDALTPPERHIGSMTTFDMQLRYDFPKHVTVALGAENLFNRKPPFAMYEASGFDWSIADPTGRFVYLKLGYTF